MRILLTGASGNLGSYVLRELRGSTHEVIAWSGTREGALFGFALAPVDFTQSASLTAACASLRQRRPEVVIHTAAMARIDACSRQPDRARQVNVDATEALLAAAADIGARSLYISTDLVFDGTTGNYSESDAPRPLSKYAQTKLAAENLCLGFANTLVVRLSLLFGPSENGRRSFFDEQVLALRRHTPLPLF